MSAIYVVTVCYCFALWITSVTFLAAALQVGIRF